MLRSQHFWLGRPALLWVYVVLMVQPYLRVALSGDVYGLVVGAAVLAALVVLAVLRGSRAAWLVALVFQIAVVIPVGEFRWWALALNVVGLACLLAPDVRRFELGDRHARAPTWAAGQPNRP